MADSTSLPNDRAALVDSSGQVTRIWFQFFRGLGATTTTDAVDLSGYLPNTVGLLGPASVNVDGSLGAGAATLRLVNDSPAPGNSRYYGTSLLGVKGWHLRDLATLADVDLTGLADGDVISWDAGLAKFVPEAPGGVNWTFYATLWDTAPIFNATITGGAVYDYTYDAVTRFRFVPSPYDPTLDAFYGMFDGVNVTVLIAARGV